MTNQAMHERLLDLIQAEDINTLFGIPDPSFFGMFIEAERRGMEIVSPHHEQAAALTADGYFRMTGKPVVPHFGISTSVTGVRGGVPVSITKVTARCTGGLPGCGRQSCGASRIN